MALVDLGDQNLCSLSVRVICSYLICPAGSLRADPAAGVAPRHCARCRERWIGGERGLLLVPAQGQASAPLRVQLPPCLVTAGWEDRDAPEGEHFIAKWVRV